ncbi:MAG TPA: peptidoglycan-binding domain-containing protein [Stellaceae bacterium]|nr:peptidoglycan-binding domain-containing protein [Stellaceae bacterium]
MRTGLISVMAVSLLTAACGSDTTQRAASGGLAGGGIGALAGGPIGALIGAGVGAAAGWATPEGADTLALNAIHTEKQVAGGALDRVGMGERNTGYASSANAQEVKRVQAELQREGLYHGHIDGIVGPKTKMALSSYQGREGLKQTATLDRDTRNHLDNAIRTARNGNEPQASSGSSVPPQQQQSQDQLDQQQLQDKGNCQSASDSTC